MERQDLPVFLVDLRETAEYVACHLVGSGHLPWSSLPNRLNELPARPASLCLVSQSERVLQEACLFLTEKGYSIRELLCCLPDPSDPDLWQIKGLLGDAFAWVQLERVYQETHSQRLWQPAPLVAYWQEQVLQNPSHTLQVLDLGCGGGRDAVYLSLQGHQVTAIEHKATVLARAKQLAAYHDCQIDFKACDLLQESCFPQGPFDAIIGIRFLERALFPLIQARLKPGGFVIWQTFSQGAQAFGSPKNPRFILKPDELKQTFTDFRVFYDRITYLADGRPVSGFIGQKHEQPQ